MTYKTYAEYVAGKESEQPTSTYIPWSQRERPKTINQLNQLLVEKLKVLEKKLGQDWSKQD